MFKKIPDAVAQSPESLRQFFNEEALAYQKEHNCRWSEACLEIKRVYGDPARVAFGAPLIA